MVSFSIIIPVYNRLDYLRECLQSVLAQTRSDWEAIVVDDASTEGDPALILTELNDARFHLMKQPHNQGVDAARNAGFGVAKAPLAVPLDADDLLAPDYLEKMYFAMVENPWAEIAIPDFQVFGLTEQIWQYPIFDAREMTLRQWIPGAGPMLRRELWVRIGGWSEVPELALGNEDWDFWLTAMEAGARAVHVPEPLYRYRQTDTSRSYRLLYDDYKTRQALYKRHQDLFDRYGTGRRFMAEGYLKSGKAYLRRKDLKTGLGLLARAVWLSRRPKDAAALTRSLFLRISQTKRV